MIAHSSPKVTTFVREIWHTQRHVLKMIGMGQAKIPPPFNMAPIIGDQSAIFCCAISKFLFFRFLTLQGLPCPRSLTIGLWALGFRWLPPPSLPPSHSPTHSRTPRPLSKLSEQGQLCISGYIIARLQKISLATTPLAVAGFLFAGVVAWQYANRLGGLFACWVFAVWCLFC